MVPAEVHLHVVGLNEIVIVDVSRSGGLVAPPAHPKVKGDIVARFESPVSAEDTYNAAMDLDRAGHSGC